MFKPYLLIGDTLNENNFYHETFDSENEALRSAKLLSNKCGIYCCLTTF